MGFELKIGFCDCRILPQYHWGTRIATYADQGKKEYEVENLCANVPWVPTKLNILQQYASEEEKEAKTFVNNQLQNGSDATAVVLACIGANQRARRPRVDLLPRYLPYNRRRRFKAATASITVLGAAVGLFITRGSYLSKVGREEEILTASFSWSRCFRPLVIVRVKAGLSVSLSPITL